MPKGNPGVPKKPRKAPKRGAAERAAVVQKVEEARKLKRKQLRKKKVQRYYRAWYVENKEQVLSKRKDRYANDPEYRERVKESVKRSRERRKKLVEKREGRKQPKSRLPAPRTFEWKGEKITLVSFGTLLQESGLTKLTLRKWIDDQVLPPCMVIDRRGHRWFPEEFVRFVRDMVVLREDLRLEGGKAWFLSHFKKIVWGKFFDQQGKIPNVCGVFADV